MFTKARVLLVEQDAHMAILLADLLAGANYEVTCAPHGTVATELLVQAHASKQPFHVVISEIVLHDVNALQLLTLARRQSPPPEVIILTGFGALSNAIEALRIRAYDYLRKPCTMGQLLLCVDGAVKQYFNAHHTPTPEPSCMRPEHERHINNSFAVDTTPMIPPVDAKDEGERYLSEGNLRLDRNHYLAFFKERQIALTPIEYALLYCMLEAKGRVLSYQELVRYSHGYEIPSVEAQTLLKPHIYHLRRKIDSSYVINVRGIGYMLSASQRHSSQREQQASTV